MIRKHTILPILALAVLFLAPSCQKDRGYSIADDGSLMLQVMLPVEQFTKASETGADELNENKVSTLDVFIYQEGEEACDHYQRITPAAGLVRYGLTKMQKDFALNAGYTVYVVANGGTATGSAKSLAELKAAVIAEALDPDAV